MSASAGADVCAALPATLLSLSKSHPGLINWLPTFFSEYYHVEVGQLGGLTMLPYIVQVGPSPRLCFGRAAPPDCSACISCQAGMGAVSGVAADTLIRAGYSLRSVRVGLQVRQTPLPRRQAVCTNWRRSRMLAGSWHARARSLPRCSDFPNRRRQRRDRLVADHGRPPADSIPCHGKTVMASRPPPDFFSCGTALGRVRIQRCQRGTGRHPCAVAMMSS